MNLTDAARAIRDRVSMEEILTLYGYRTSHGFLRCPFHGDRNASLRVYPDGWYCFGCGKGGSVIDFVMEQENCGFVPAVKAIDHACGLNLLSARENPQDAESFRSLRLACDRYAGSVVRMLLFRRAAVEERQRKRLRQVREAEIRRREQPEKTTAEEYMILLLWKEEAEEDDRTLDSIRALREEVEAWRRKAGRALSACSGKAPMPAVCS